MAEEKADLRSQLARDRVDIEILQAIATQANPQLAAAIILQSKDFFARLSPEQVAVLKDKLAQNPTRDRLGATLKDVPFLTDAEKVDLMDSVPPAPPQNLQLVF
jgi:hypothetical protein